MRTRSFLKVFSLLSYLVGGGLALLLFQNLSVPVGTGTPCSTAGRLNIESNVPQFCDGNKFVSMKNANAGGCSGAGQLRADATYCDGGTAWSMRGPAIGSCAVDGQMAWTGSVPSFCVSGTLYSASTPSYAIAQAFQAVLGRPPTGNESNSLLAGLNPSLVSAADISAIVQQGLAQNSSLSSASDSNWSVSSNSVSAQATACTGGKRLQNGACLPAVCTPKAIQSCGLNGNFAMQTCADDGSAWGACQAPGYLSSQSVVDNYVEVRTQPNQYLYNYAPDMIYENGLYHMYWCAGVGAAGDYILHAQSNVASGPFHASNSAAPFSYDVALQPTWNTGNFDGYEACDPSVMKVGGTYFLYYGGLATQSNNTSTTKIGVAVSSDAVHFSRANGGNPIVAPISFTPNTGSYGAGQPSVFYIAPYYYMSFTDSTGPAGNGQYMIRSPDPLFASGIQELTGAGQWTARGALSRSGQYKWLQAFSIDIALDTQSNRLLVASDQTQGQHWVYVVDTNSFANYGYVAMNGTWADGASILKNPDRTMLARGSCTTIDMQIYKGDSPTGAYSDVRTWNISRSQGVFQLAPSVCGQ